LAWITTRLNEIAAPSRYARLLVGTGSKSAGRGRSSHRVRRAPHPPARPPCARRRAPRGFRPVRRSRHAPAVLGPAALRVGSVLAGGAAGALARAGVGQAFPHDPGRWPWATFGVNIAGTLLLAWITAQPGVYRRLLVGTGFCGALTTFSTLQVETIQLARDGRFWLAVAYAATSIAVGMAAAVLVSAAVRRRQQR
ncbi:MAG TPA: CrcB family protein, partial [Solirubrobacter sp.]|nr:CrcB family protein [Solirubrobacter sp.]